MPQNISGQGRPDYCFGKAYVLGGAAQDISKIITNVGLLASVLGAPEVGLPMAAIGGAIGLGGSYLQDRAAGKVIGVGTAFNAGATAITTAFPAAKGSEVAGAFIAQGLGQAGNSAINYAQGANLCE